MGQINTKKIAILLILLVLVIYVVFRFLGRETSGISYRTAQVDRNDIISLARFVLGKGARKGVLAAKTSFSGTW